MKKRYLSLVLTVILVVACALTLCACSVDDGYITYKKKKGEYILTTCQKEASGTIIIPSEINGIKVTTIGENAFAECDSIKEVVIPDGVTKIESGAFSGCDGLLKVTIPESVTSIGNWAFGDCRELTEINYNAKTIDSAYDVFSCAGQNGNGITVNFGANVEKIPAGIFGGHSYYYYSEESNNIINLTEVNFAPESVCKSVGEDAFKFCKNLTTITLPASLEEFDTSAFAYCDSLTSVAFEDPGNWKWTPAFTYDVDLTSPTNNMAFFRDRNAAFIYKDRG